MKKSFIKRYKWILVVLGVVLLVFLAAYIFAPQIDSIRYSLEMDDLDDWQKLCLREDKEENGLFLYDSPYGWDAGEGFHEPQAEDEVFAFDGVTELEDGVYLTGARGITDWAMNIRIYARKNFERDLPDRKSGDGEDSRLWKFYFTCEGAEDNQFPLKASQEKMTGRKFMGYSESVWLAAPVRIGEDGTVTLVYHYGDNNEKEKEIKIPVEHKKIGE